MGTRTLFEDFKQDYSGVVINNHVSLIAYTRFIIIPAI